MPVTIVDLHEGAVPLDGGVTINISSSSPTTKPTAEESAAHEFLKRVLAISRKLQTLAAQWVDVTMDGLGGFRPPATVRESLAELELGMKAELITNDLQSLTEPQIDYAMARLKEHITEAAKERKRFKPEERIRAAADGQALPLSGDKEPALLLPGDIAPKDPALEAFLLRLQQNRAVRDATGRLIEVVMHQHDLAEPDPGQRIFTKPMTAQGIATQVKTQEADIKAKATLDAMSNEDATLAANTLIARAREKAASSYARLREEAALGLKRSSPPGLGR